MISGAPIKVLSNEVALQTATAVKEFYELCEAAGTDYHVLPEETRKRILELNLQMGRIVFGQFRLLKALDSVTEEQVMMPAFAKAISDLELVVAQVGSAVSETYAAPAFVVKLVKKNLETIADQNAHLDSYVESFRVAFDENCTALLANLATEAVAG